MKKLLVVLLSLGLIVAFSAPASAAVDVQFSGLYYVAGAYDNNPNITNAPGFSTYSRAAIYQQVRIQTVFKVAEGLSLTTRFDALEKNWGAVDYRGVASTGPNSQGDKTNSRVYTSRGTAGVAGNIATMAGNNIQENIEFERGYITFATKIGQFDVGYQGADAWGTTFGNSTATRPRVMYTTKFGPMTILGVYEKAFEADQYAGQIAATGVYNYRGIVDADADNYYLGGIYNFKGGEAGLLYKYAVNAAQRVQALQYKTKAQALVPYFKATLGPVYLEGEGGYLFGKAAISDIAGTPDTDLSQMSAYLHAKMNVGPAYFGALFAWIQGDGDKANEINNPGFMGPNSGLEGGYDWCPTLMFTNVNISTWVPNAPSTMNSYKNDSKGFMWYGIYGGFNPTTKLNLEANLTFLAFDKKKYFAAGLTRNVAQLELISDKIGTEIDVTATYKIYDNLTYQLGAGYLIAGDAWKGVIGSTAEVSNNYILQNKLQLTF